MISEDDSFTGTLVYTSPDKIKGFSDWILNLQCEKASYPEEGWNGGLTFYMRFIDSENKQTVFILSPGSPMGNFIKKDNGEPFEKGNWFSISWDKVTEFNNLLKKNIPDERSVERITIYETETAITKYNGFLYY